jgi:hypothetical protein
VALPGGEVCDVQLVKVSTISGFFAREYPGLTTINKNKNATGKKWIFCILITDPLWLWVVVISQKRARINLL